ncbi:MAG: hypothetical protein AABY22_34920, partial [Nanoarchaeota archaeon]
MSDNDLKATKWIAVCVLLAILIIVGAIAYSPASPEGTTSVCGAQATADCVHEMRSGWRPWERAP